MLVSVQTDLKRIFRYSKDLSDQEKVVKLVKAFGVKSGDIREVENFDCWAKRSFNKYLRCLFNTNNVKYEDFIK